MTYIEIFSRNKYSNNIYTRKKFGYNSSGEHQNTHEDYHYTCRPYKEIISIIVIKYIMGFQTVWLDIKAMCLSLYLRESSKCPLNILTQLKGITLF